ncbi:DUF6392 family protein, partial [Pseudomonas chlororaphis]|uniref:DUF6392 family protein n=1 Tax=Pseudomonas chlororaphis TaxID=587753 RepID=UPI003C19B8B2
SSTMGWPQLRPRKNLTSCPGLVDHYNQTWVKSQYGEPLESGAPYRVPISGMTGGWDTYRLPGMSKSIHVLFKYTVEMEVEGIVFRLNERSHA